MAKGPFKLAGHALPGPNQKASPIKEPITAAIVGALAATVGSKGVVIFGGFISPEITGYDFHTNLFTGGEACGSRYSCKHCKAAMEAIEVDEVVEHMRKIINV